MKSNLAAVVLFLTNLFISVKSSLPELYHVVGSKRGIPVKNFRHVEKCGLKVTKLKLDVQYFETCLELDLCPPKFKLKDAKVKSPDLNKRIHKVLVEEALKNTLHSLETAKEVYAESLKAINPILSLVERASLNKLLSARYDNESKKVYDRHKKKLFHLWTSQSKYSPDCITDISSRGLTLQEKNALQFGLYHHILPKSFDRDQVKVNVEELVDSVVWRTKEKVGFDLRDEIKRHYFDFEKEAKKVCSSKKNQMLHRTLRNLSKEKSIRVCSYDKGTGVVVMDSVDYYNKLNSTLDDVSKFVKINVDHSTPKCHPVVVRQRKVKYYIKKYIPEEDQKGLPPVGSQPGKLYGLCKVHKDGFPMRPIVSMINTPEYNLSKYLDNFIKPNIPKTFMLKSTDEFLTKINDFHLTGNEVMVSYDVVSLFTNVPLLETIDIIIDLAYGPDSVNIPPFSKSIFRKMLIFCSQSYFMFNDELFQQVDGVSMGGPLAPSFANAFLAHLENNKFTDFNSAIKPKLFLRYVDDCFALFNCFDDALLFLNYLNTVHPSINFTIERGDLCMPFLDVKINIFNRTFVTSVFRKSTHTGVFLNFFIDRPHLMEKGCNILSFTSR